MTGTNAAAVTIELGQRTAWISGHHATVVPAIKAARAPRQWDAARHSWRIPVVFADDVTAAVELQVGGDVEVIRVDR